MNTLISQINSKVGDLIGNYQKICKIYHDNREKVDLIIFPELSVTGYPPEDLLLSPAFQERALEVQSDICKLTADSETMILYGGINKIADQLYNVGICVKKGVVSDIVSKSYLPNYGVFDEKRYFCAGDGFKVVELGQVKFLVLICEDLWDELLLHKINQLEFDKIIILNASPYNINKYQRRFELVTNLSIGLEKEVIYVNMVGGQDSLVFDGRSFVTNKSGQLVKLLQGFTEDNAIVTDVDNDVIIYHDDKTANIYQALLLGIEDYILKNGFSSVLIGLSGGIDSALCAVLAGDALGVDQVNLVKMPSQYTSQDSFRDANKLITNMGCNNDTEIAISKILESLLIALTPHFANKKKDITEENLQSRIRGVILMALSNKLNHLVLSTSNKSESAVGYATLYGDMCGAYAPLKDIYKTTIYDLVEWRNNNIPANSKCQILDIIPQNIIIKEPTAELKEQQKDSDNLPEYSELDKILKNLIEKRLSISEIVALGLDAVKVKKISNLLFTSEYKRRQSPIGPKISNLSFDKDRRYPITNGYPNN